MTYYLLGLGSNIRPKANLAHALEALTELGDLIGYSPAVFTEPVGETFSQEFGNQLVLLSCDLPAPMLKQRLQRIEEMLGREPKSPARKMRDRTIDIDILGDAVDIAAARALRPEESYYAEVYDVWDQSEKV